MGQRITVNYFVESREEAKSKGYHSRVRFLEECVFTEEVVRCLRDTVSGVCLAAFAKEDGISSVVKELNRQGIVTDLWLNLPYEHGYWQSRANVPAARREVESLLNWIGSEGLRIRNIGIDVEPAIEIAPHIVNLKITKIILQLMRLNRPKDAQQQFELMLQTINEAHGVDFYQLPLIGSYAISRRVFNLHDVPACFYQDSRNKVVSMLYSSLTPFHAARFVESYIRNDEIPAIGIVSADGQNPGVELPQSSRRRKSQLLSQEFISRDVRQVKNVYQTRRQSPTMYVFALNGMGTLEKVARAINAAN